MILVLYWQSERNGSVYFILMAFKWFKPYNKIGNKISQMKCLQNWPAFSVKTCVFHKFHENVTILEKIFFLVALIQTGVVLLFNYKS